MPAILDKISQPTLTRNQVLCSGFQDRFQKKMKKMVPNNLDKEEFQVPTGQWSQHRFSLCKQEPRIDLRTKAELTETDGHKMDLFQRPPPKKKKKHIPQKNQTHALTTTLSLCCFLLQVHLYQTASRLVGLVKQCSTPHFQLCCTSILQPLHLQRPPKNGPVLTYWCLCIPFHQDTFKGSFGIKHFTKLVSSAVFSSLKKTSSQKQVHPIHFAQPFFGRGQRGWKKRLEGISHEDTCGPYTPIVHSILGSFGFEVG